jgi:hypothetical protein
MTDRSPRRQRSTAGVILAASAATGLLMAAAVPADAQAYKVTLKNGNTFISKYEPEDATYDPSKMVIITDVGNRIALAKDDVVAVVLDIENRGFGIMLDTTTIMVGFTANDAPGGEEGEEGGDPTLVQMPTPASTLPTIFSGSFPVPGFPEGGFVASGGSSGAAISEPGSFSAGIPLSFVGGGTVPVVPPN